MSDREIVTTRLIDAPRERIFEAFSDPDHLTRWWGPKGFSRIAVDANEQNLDRLEAGLSRMG